jgi:hypothetical protein
MASVTKFLFTGMTGHAGILQTLSIFLAVNLEFGTITSAQRIITPLV